MYKKYFKRLLDLIIALTFLILFFPLFIIISFIIFIQDGGSPFFRQKRVGKNEKEFVLIKFRSMPVNTKDLPSSSTKQLKITPFGKFIRRSNLDELPQLINIFFGDMSLIGPRPSLITQFDLIDLRRTKDVYDCRPGLTGLAQVNSFDGMPNEKKVHWDGMYSKKISFIQDFKIILNTFVYLTKKPPTY